jgi:5'-nucleotidase
MQQPKRIFVDMDGVLVDFAGALTGLSEYTKDKYAGRFDEVPGIFGTMNPLPGAVEAFNLLVEHYDVHLLSTAPWDNPSAWTDKILWVQKYLGDAAYKRLTLTHHKNLAIGDYLIDDRTANGAGEFDGEHIHFGTEKFPDWNAVLTYFDLSFSV